MSEQPPEEPPGGSGGSGPPEVPETEPVSTDPTRATIESVMLTVTGQGPNIHGALENGRVPGNGWFIFKGGSSDGRELGETTPAPGYGAWEKWYFKTERNEAAFNEWKRLYDEMTGLMNDLLTLRVQYFDVFMMAHAGEAVRAYTGWLTEHHGILQGWEAKLSSDHSEFEGKAANVVRQNLETIAATMRNLHDQITIERNVPGALDGAVAAMYGFAVKMSQMWHAYGKVSTMPDAMAYAVHMSIYKYLTGKGLTGQAFDKLTGDLGREGVEEYIRGIIAGYHSEDGVTPSYDRGPGVDATVVGGSIYVEGTEGGPTEASTFEPHPLPYGLGPLSGPLDQQSTWDTINARITDITLNYLKGLDEFARKQFEELERAYEKARTALQGLDEPIVESPGGSSGGGAGPDIPRIEFDDPPKFEFDDPPDFEFPPTPDVPDIPGLSGPGMPELEVPEFPGTPEFPGPDFPDTPGNPDVPNFNGPDVPGMPESPPPNFGGPEIPGLPESPPPNFGGGNGDPYGGGGTIPPPVPFPPYSNGGRPDNNNRFDPNKLPDYPDYPDYDSDTGGPDDRLDQRSPDLEFPPGGSGPDLDSPSTDGPNLPGGGLGGGNPDGNAVSQPGGGAAGGGSAGGEGWSDWTGESEDQTTSQQQSGSGPFGNRLPMMPPPMIPPMNPGNQKERERQTWLSEDEKVWGTRSLAGSGVIGLPADLANEVDEQLAPTHVHVRTIAPHTKSEGQRPEEQKSEDQKPEEQKPEEQKPAEEKAQQSS